MSNPLVTAIIPAYGRPDRTQRAIESVTRQAYTPIELIVVDDGSNPPLADRIELPESARLICHDENQGANAARITGIRAADGEYLAFLDSDDEWLPEKITRQIEALEGTNARATYAAVKNVDANGNYIQVETAVHAGDVQQELLNRNVIGTFSTLLISAGAVDDVGYPDPDLACWQDWEWYLRLSDEVKFIPISDVLTIRHNEGGQVSNIFGPRRKSAYQTVRKRIRERTRTPVEERVAVANLTYRLGYTALTNHEFSTARQCFFRSIRGHPWNLSVYKHLAAAGPHYPVARRIKRKISQLVDGE